ncbi:MAG: glycosyltransferase family 39 protein [Planctomycetes bacterium]|nr:glycosyltransferase family 39 protein [Planctomycetota bacterium]
MSTPDTDAADAATARETPSTAPPTPCGRLPHFCFAIVLAGAAALFSYRLDIVGLDEPSEGRYAIISADMLAAGDFIVPRLNGKPHLEKPPFTYWCIAASIAAFGRTDFAARFPSAVAGTGALALAMAVGWVLYGRRVGLLAGLVLVGCPQFFLQARGVTTDMLLVLWVWAALLAYFVCLRRPEARRGASAAFLCAGVLAVLTKGTAAWVGIYFPILLHAVACGDWRTARELRVGRAFLVSVLALVPWLALMERCAPGSVGYMLWRSVSSVYTAKRAHPGPPWMYLWVLGCGAFPWVLLLVPAGLRGGLGRLALGLVRTPLPGRSGPVRTWSEFGRASGLAAWRASADGAAVLLASGSAGIFLFFSALPAKLPAYILPIYPAIAILVARFVASALDGGPEAASARRTVGVLAAATATLAVLAALVPLATTATLEPLFRLLPRAAREDYLPEVPRISLYLAPLFPAVPFVVVGLGAVASLLLASRRFRSLLPAVACVALLGVGLELGGLFLLGRMEGTLEKSVRRFAWTLRARIRPEDPLVSYNCFPRALKYYLDHPVTVVAKDGDEPELYGEIEYTGCARVAEFLESPRCVYCVVPMRRIPELLLLTRRFRVLDTCGNLLLGTNQ